MNKGRIFFLGVVLLFVFASCSAQTNNGGVFSLVGECLGVVVNNKVQFYVFNDGKWEIYPDLDFTLPNGYKGIFDCRGDIGVVLNNKVQFYRYDEKWEIDSSMDFTLPNGYKDVFYFDGVFGVVVNNKVQFYDYDDGKWEIYSDLDFTLPNGYKEIFYFDNDGNFGTFRNYECLGVVLNNKVQFYDYDHNDEKWKTDSDLNFTLPNGYKGFVYYDDGYLGVVLNNKVQFYQWDNNWKIDLSMDFTLPKR